MKEDERTFWIHTIALCFFIVTFSISLALESDFWIFWAYIFSMFETWCIVDSYNDMKDME